MSSPQPSNTDHAAALQSILGSLGVLTVAQLVDLFNTYSATAGFAGLLHTVVPEIVGQHAQAAATVTAQWYDELAPDLPFQATPVVNLPPERIKKSIDWALHAPTAPTAPTPEAPPSTTPTSDDVLSRLSGSTKRMVYDASRDTVVQNASVEGVKWARYASANACPFCKVLAIRGHVYSSEQAALKAHDHCRCLAVPQRDGQTFTRPSYMTAWEGQYQSARDAVSAAGQRQTLQNILSAMRRNAGSN